MYTNYEYWLIIKKAGNQEKLVKDLTENDTGGHFPDVNRSIGVFSCLNGVYHNRHVDKNGKLTWKFYEYESSEIIPANLIASRFYDIEFTAHKYTPNNSYKDYHKIPTPYFDQITKYQFEINDDYGEDIYDLLLVLIGRLPAELCKWDKWEVFLFLVVCSQILLLMADKSKAWLIV